LNKVDAFFWRLKKTRDEFLDYTKVNGAIAALKAASDSEYSKNLLEEADDYRE